MAAEGLFRQQAIEHASGRLYGEVLVRPVASHLILTTAAALWCVAALYLAFRVEWTRHQTIDGIFAAKPAGLGASLYVPASVRQRLEVGHPYYVSVDGLNEQAWTVIVIEHISEELLPSCPICTANASREPYVRADALVPDPMVRLDGQWLSLAQGVRFHFDIALEKQNLSKLLSDRF